MNVLFLFVASVFILSAVLVASATTAPAAVSAVDSPAATTVPAARGATGAAADNSGGSCVSNGFLTARVDGPTGLYTFDIGSCAAVGAVEDDILYPLGTSFATVADFTSGVDYTEGGYGRGVSLGAPTSSGVVGDSIITVFSPTAEGLVVTQNITVEGSAYSDSAILMNVKVVNTDANPQEVGVRYLWDAQVGGYDGTWLQEYDGATAGAITGYETAFSPPPANFTSYAIGGCSQGPVVPPPYACDSSDFGAGSGAISAFGSISYGPGATAPARFVYGWWRAMFSTAYGYVSNPLNQVGSYAPNVGGAQDSAMLYYFSNETLQGTGGVLSYQADIATASIPASVSLSSTSGAVGTPVTVTGADLAPLKTVTLNSFGSLGPVPLSGACATDSSGDLSASGGCTFLVPNSPAGVYTLTFSDGVSSLSVKFTVSFLTLTCSSSTLVVGSTTTCKATAHESGTALLTGRIAWSSNSAGRLSSTSCTLSRHGSSSTCSVRFTPTAAGSSVTLTASYGGDAKNPSSVETYGLNVTKAATDTAVSCTPRSARAGSSTTITCTADPDCVLWRTCLGPTGVVSWSQSGTGTVSFGSAMCTLSGVDPICSVTMTAVSGGSVDIAATYAGDSNNQGSSGTAKLTVKA